MLGEVKWNSVLKYWMFQKKKNGAVVTENYGSSSDGNNNSDIWRKHSFHSRFRQHLCLCLGLTYCFFTTIACLRRSRRRRRACRPSGYRRQSAWSKNGGCWDGEICDFWAGKCLFFCSMRTSGGGRSTRRRARHEMREGLPALGRQVVYSKRDLVKEAALLQGL